jgi:polyketide cyclase/dehydrase/lipid transport protein
VAAQTGDGGMSRLRVSAAGVIPARPEKVYKILADYRVHHPHIVPREYFRRLEVEEGGVGAGTRTLLEMRVLGATRVVRHVISEPQPGRVLVEADPHGSSRTSFTVDPVPAGEATRLTIATEIETRGGVLGILERFLVKLALRRIYRRELALLESYAARPID